MRRKAAVLAVAFSALAISACGGSSGSSSSGSSGSGPAAYDGKPVTITFWNPFTAAPAGGDEQRDRRLPQAAPDHHGQERGRHQRRQDRRGDPWRQSPPDLALSQAADNLGKYCGTGAWIDLTPYIQRDNVNLGELPAGRRATTPSTTATAARSPMLADVYGLYYNKAMLAKAGITSPPKTFSELTADAKKLTVEPRRLDQGGRASSRHDVLRERRGALRAAVGRAVGRERQVVAGHRPRTGPRCCAGTRS